jgi:hypothetical protein
VLRVTADSNIYISALHFGGPPDDFLNLARAGKIHLSISDEIMDVPAVRARTSQCRRACL